MSAEDGEVEVSDIVFLEVKVEIIGSIHLICPSVVVSVRPLRVGALHRETNWKCVPEVYPSSIGFFGYYPHEAGIYLV